MSKLAEKLGKNYKSGDVIFSVGDSGNSMYIIHKGSVKISIKAKAAEQVVAQLKEGDFFGEIALFTNRKRTATATVSSDSTILSVNRDSIESLLSSNQGFGMNMIQKLCMRIFSANQKVEELLVLSKETRILRYLANFWKVSGSKDGDYMVVSYNLFLDYLQSSIGIDKKSSITFLTELKNQKLIDTKESDKDMKILFLPSIFYTNNLS